jgi:C-terminal processing protease CtpA/Prc
MTFLTTSFCFINEGIKIVGGRVNPLTNQLSAYVVKIKKNSISDTIGRLQVGDEVTTWNGKPMRGLTYDQVYSILNKSKEDSTVELTVERPIE